MRKGEGRRARQATGLIPAQLHLLGYQPKPSTNRSRGCCQSLKESGTPTTLCPLPMEVISQWHEYHFHLKINTKSNFEGQRQSRAWGLPLPPVIPTYGVIVIGASCLLQTQVLNRIVPISIIPRESRTSLLSKRKLPCSELIPWKTLL